MREGTARRSVADCRGTYILDLALPASCDKDFSPSPAGQAFALARPDRVQGKAPRIEREMETER
jgi:hypothetical protein